MSCSTSELVPPWQLLVAFSSCLLSPACMCATGIWADLLLVPSVWQQWHDQGVRRTTGDVQCRELCKFFPVVSVRGGVYPLKCRLLPEIYQICLLQPNIIHNKETFS